EMTWIASHPAGPAQLAAASSEKAHVVAAREAELASSADAVVTLSETMVAELWRRGVDPRSIAVVPNGVEASLLTEHATPPVARESLGLTSLHDSFIVGAV